MAAEITKLQGCCKKAEDLRAAGNENRPGLEALDYRIGTHGSFLAYMLDRLSEYSLPREKETDPMQNPLAALTSREGDDFSIALLDGWAIVADVLSFYQERIANEGYLRTATERRSILELAKLIGYAPKPGVSASVDLAFSLEKGCNAEIPAGTRVQSLPNPGETPQTFESSEKVAGRAEWNLLKPRTVRPPSLTWEIACSDQEFFLYFQGTGLNLQPNQAMLFVLGDERGQQVMRLIKSAEPEPKMQRTKVILQKKAFLEKAAAETSIRILPNRIRSNRFFDDFERYIKNRLTKTNKPDRGALFSGFKRPIGPQREDEEMRNAHVPKDLFPLHIHVLRLTASLFGHNAPRKISIIQNPSSALTTLDFGPQLLVADDQARYVFDWDNISGTDRQKLIDFLKTKFGDDWTNVDWHTNIINVSSSKKSLSIELVNNGTVAILEIDDGRTDKFIVIADQINHRKIYQTGILHLDNTYNKILPESWIVVRRERDDAKSDEGSIDECLLISRAEEVTSCISRSTYDLAGKTTRIELKRNDASILNNFAELRQTVIYAQSEDLTAKLAEESIEADVMGKVLELDGYYDGLEKGRSLIVSGQARAGTGTIIAAAEKVVLADTWHGLLTTMSGSPAPQVKLKIVKEAKSLYVENWEAYSKELFEEAPEFAACSKGATPRRTCVQVKKWDGSVNGIPDLIADIDYSAGLEKLDFPIGSNTGFLFLELRDRAKNVSYVSNLINIDPNATNNTNNITPPSVVLMERSLFKDKDNKNKIHYEFAVTNWSEYTVLKANAAVNIHYPGKTSIQQIEITSNKDLASLSFNVSVEGNWSEPHYFYIGIEQNGNKCLSNLISTVPNSFLPGDSPHTTLILAEDLENVYLRDTVEIYANLARATHGETRNEVLGSGDSAQALQQFKLRHYPLTYLPAPTPTGAVSTLQLRVNDVLWHESDSLLGLGPKSRSYIIRTDAEIKSSVTFGNGQKGARPPTGVENVKAKYRSGIGKPGNVQAGQIRLLATKPLGLKGVINPLPASGGADPESNDQARRNAPLTVMALDRLVSVQDYEDLARCFAGIGKASATLLTDGKREVVHVSIAGADDIPIDEDSDLFQNLFLALRRAGDPYQPLVLDLCERLILLIRAKVRLLPDYEWQSVEPKIRAALLQAFGFANRDPGQEVFHSEIISVIQAVPGVAYVDLDLVDDISETEALDLVKTTQKIRSLMDELSRSSSGEEATDGKPVTQDRIDVEKARVVKAHIVEDGETLASIAELYDGTTDADLLYLNSGLLEENPGLLVSTPLEKSKPIQIWPQLLPAQIAYLSADIPEAVVLKELI